MFIRVQINLNVIMPLITFNKIKWPCIMQSNSYIITKTTYSSQAFFVYLIDFQNCNMKMYKNL